jgi:hypothetical protein
LHICPERRVPLSEKKDPKPHERNETAQDKGQFRCSSLPDAMFFAIISDLFAAAFSVTFAGNLICSAFFHDLLHLSSGRPDPIYLLSPMHGVPLLCC